MIEKLNGTTETVDFDVSSSVRLYRNVDPECFPQHWHIAGEIICPIEDIYTVTIAGQTVTLLPHDVLLIASGELHSIEAPPQGERYILNFSTALFEQFPDLSQFLDSLYPFRLLRREDNPDFNDQLFAQLVHLETEYFSDNAYLDCEITAQMLHFFSMIGRQLRKQAAQQALSSPPKQLEHQERFTELCNYINAHCTENLSVDELAAEAGFSKYHFSRLFKEMTGTTCHNYLITRRIIFAKSLLIDFSIPITEVAMRSGFNSLATFNRLFKSEIGCTPTEFRKLSQSACPKH